MGQLESSTFSLRHLIPVLLLCVAGGPYAWGADSLQPDLKLEKIGQITQGPPAQMVFGPDGRLYVSLANFGSADAASVASYAYNPLAGLSDERISAATGGALGIAFGPVGLGNYGDANTVVTTGMYLTDTARDGNSNLRVLTAGANGLYGSPGAVNTVVAANIPAGWHQADQLQVKPNLDGTSSLFVGIGVRTKDGASGYPNPDSARDPAWGGTISTIKDMRQVNGKVVDSAGFGLTGNSSSNSQPDYSNASPYTSSAQNKLVVYASGARNPFGLGLDGSGNLWFTNNFNRSQSDGTFNGTIDPQTHLVRGYTTGDPAPGPDLKNNVYDQFFKAVSKGDYGYNNVNWRDDAAHHNPDVKSQAAIAAGFFDPAHLIRSATFDNLSKPAQGFQEYNQSDINHIVGLGPSSSSDGFAFYTGNAFPVAYQGDAFIARWVPSITDALGNVIEYADVVAVDPTTGIARRIASGFTNPIDVAEDGNGSLLVADYGDGSIWRISAVSPAPEPAEWALLSFGGVLVAGLAHRNRRRSSGPAKSNPDHGMAPKGLSSKEISGASARLRGMQDRASQVADTRSCLRAGERSRSASLAY